MPTWRNLCPNCGDREPPQKFIVHPMQFMIRWCPKCGALWDIRSPIFGIEKNPEPEFVTRARAFSGRGGGNNQPGDWRATAGAMSPTLEPSGRNCPPPESLGIDSDWLALVEAAQKRWLKENPY